MLRNNISFEVIRHFPSRMQRRILLYFVQLCLLYFNSEVESLIGSMLRRTSNRELPFIASLQYFPEGQHFCTGTLITKKHVLTAAHCLEDESPTEVQVAIGVDNLQSNSIKYNVSSWLTFDGWAARLGIRKEPVSHDIAIVILKSNEREPNEPPARLSELNKKQVTRKTASLIGWKDLLLHKVTVKILSDDQCEHHIRVVTNDLQESSPRTLCSAAEPHALLQCGDSGGPFLDGNNNLLGVNFGDCPDPQYAWGNFSEEYLQKYLVNLHFSVDYYRDFIVNVTGYH